MSGEQEQYQVRFDWGRSGAAAVGADADVVVWADAVPRAGAGPDLADLPARPAVVVADVRTARAAGAWVADLQLRLERRIAIAIVAAGDVRADGSWRYAVEDHLVAGAVIDALGTFGIDATSPEAAVADAAYRGLAGAVGHLVTASVTGRAASLTPSGLRVDGDLGAADAVVLRPHPDAA